MPTSRRRFLQHLATGAATAAAFPGLAFDAAARAAGPARELRCDVLVIGGQATAQGVPLDEHPWNEQFGATKTYRDFRTGGRDYHRRNYPLTPAARSDPHLNPGAAWVTALGFEPRVGLAVHDAMLAPHLSSGRILILPRHRPTAVPHLADFQRELGRQGVELDWPKGFRETSRSYYSHHNLELKDAGTFYFGEADRLPPLAPRS